MGARLWERVPFRAAQNLYPSHFFILYIPYKKAASYLDAALKNLSAAGSISSRCFVSEQEIDFHVCTHKQKIRTGSEKDESKLKQTEGQFEKSNTNQKKTNKTCPADLYNFAGFHWPSVLVFVVPTNCEEWVKKKNNDRYKLIHKIRELDVEVEGIRCISTK